LINEQFYPPGDLTIAAPTDRQTRRNDDIRVPFVRLIDETGENVGVVARLDAVKRARDAELDLVEIVPNSDPPVCRIMDFGKYRFELQKKAHEAKKKQKSVEIKEMKFRPGTDDGDYDVKLRQIRGFLAEGDKVKINLRFKGREMAHLELGDKMLNRIDLDLREEALIEQRSKIEGRIMSMMIAPRKPKQ